jgi:hyperosmotically inducible periplasmic protein
MQFRIDPHYAVAVLLLASVGSHAQTDASTENASSSTGTSLTKKQIRHQNFALEKTVRHTLQKTKNLDSSNIVIVARGGNVTLEGSVLEAGQIDLAGESAARAPGVKHVDNRITVREVP